MELEEQKERRSLFVFLCLFFKPKTKMVMFGDTPPLYFKRKGGGEVKQEKKRK